MGEIHFGEVTIPATGSITLASGVFNIIEGTLIAHPSNSGIIYVKSEGPVGLPLSAGASFSIGRTNLSMFTVSGATNDRLIWGYNQ